MWANMNLGFPRTMRNASVTLSSFLVARASYRLVYVHILIVERWLGEQGHVFQELRLLASDDLAQTFRFEGGTFPFERQQVRRPPARSSAIGL
jgi:hypothetical protein